MTVMPPVSPGPMHPFPSLSPMAMMQQGLPIMAGAPMMRPAAPTHMLPPGANPAFLQQHQLAMMGLRPPFGAMPGPAPGNYILLFYNIT